jgi:hypothetical protein
MIKHAEDNLLPKNILTLQRAFLSSTPQDESSPSWQPTLMPRIKKAPSFQEKATTASPTAMNQERSLLQTDGSICELEDN